MVDEQFGAPPPIARQHCRHYSYQRGLEGGPRCALDVDLSAPGATARCMPNPKADCDFRSDWTDEERKTWEDWQEGRTHRMFAAIAALPPIERNSQATIDCPSCDGRLTGQLGRARAYVNCSTPHCTSFEAALKRDDSPWPQGAQDD